jgi:GDP-4-dehydro-6-deoxy-D-mannose reductase
MNKSIVLVTGASGFVGPYLIEHLLFKGYKVIALSYRNSLRIDSNNLIVEQCDITNKDALLNLVQQYKPSKIFHLAGLTKPNSEDTIGFYDVNFYGTLNLLESAKRINASVLLVSSAYVYAKSNSIIDEEHPVKPLNHYGVSKSASEMLGSIFANDGLKVVIARPFNHTGSNQEIHFLVPSLLYQVYLINKGLKEPVISIGNLDSIRDFTDVRDVVKAYTLILDKGTSGDVYNVCSGLGWSVKELYEKAISYCNQTVTLEVKKILKRSADISYLVGNPIKTKEIIGWESDITLDKTFESIISSFSE